jgi:hypothetical protein
MMSPKKNCPMFHYYAIIMGVFWKIPQNSEKLEENYLSCQGLPPEIVKGCHLTGMSKAALTPRALPSYRFM